MVNQFNIIRTRAKDVFSPHFGKYALVVRGYNCEHLHQNPSENTLFCVCAIFSRRILGEYKAKDEVKPDDLTRLLTQYAPKFATQNRVRIILNWLTGGKYEYFIRREL